VGEGSEGERRPYRRLTADERGRFLAVLRETGNRKAAAAAIGVEPRLMDQRREHDPELDRDWREAAEAAHRGLSEATGPFDCPQEDKFNTIRRGKGGRLQRVAAGDGRWTAGVERRFMAALRRFGSVRAAAHAVGFSEGAVWDRRRKWPAFAEKVEQLLDEAELELEFRIASMGSNLVPADDDSETEEAEEAEVAPAPPVPFDPDFAMRFLKWREEKRRGRGRWAPRAKPPTIEQVTEKIVRRVLAIKRHRERGGGE
jgi:hypothetical protein